MNETEEFSNLNPLLEMVPETSFLYGPDSYAAMDPDTKGDWRFIMEGKTKLGFMWTDWLDSVGIVGFAESDYFGDLRSFLLAAKSAGVPAGNAFTALGSQIEKTAPKGVTVSETENGFLSDVLESLFETSESDTENE